jgi:propionyl-CoA carboxylase beta chain
LHSEITGLSTFTEQNEFAAIMRARQLLEYLPQHCYEMPLVIHDGIKKKKSVTDLETIIPADNSKRGYDMVHIINEIADDDSFLEIYARFAPNIVTGFAKLGEGTIGIAANQPLFLSGILDVDSSRKLFRFVQLCDAYNIPLLFIADSPGFMPGREQEHASMISLGARVLSILSNSTIPKITLIVNKIIGGAYGAMSSRGLGADMVLAWPTAKISVLGTDAALQVLHKKEIDSAENTELKTQEKINAFEEQHMTPYKAAEHGQLDAIIIPSHTRKTLLKAFIVLQHKVSKTIKKRRTILPM